jgi:hypothetical protein
MWMNHYKDLYNSVDDSQSKNLVCQHIESKVPGNSLLLAPFEGEANHANNRPQLEADAGQV